LALSFIQPSVLILKNYLNNGGSEKLSSKKLLVFAILFLLFIGTVSMMCGCGGSGSTTSTGGSNPVSAATLTHFTVTPAGQSAPKGLTQKFTATGFYNDNSTQDISSRVRWTCSNDNLATVDATGLLTTKETGVVTVTAQEMSTLMKESVTFTITDAVMTGIEISPANATVPQTITAQLDAYAVYSDGSKYKVTSQAVWSSSNTNVATIDAQTGQITAISAGQTTITCTFGTEPTSQRYSVSSVVVVNDAALTSLEVTTDPADQITAPVGVTVQYVAVGHFSDGSSINLGADPKLAWSLQPVGTDVASINASGVLTTLKAGECTATATFSPPLGAPIVAGKGLAITSSPITSISITPDKSHVPVNTSQQFYAIATLGNGTTCDITNSVTWTSSKPTELEIYNSVTDGQLSPWIPRTFQKGEAKMLLSTGGTVQVSCALPGTSLGAATDVTIEVLFKEWGDQLIPHDGIYGSEYNQQHFSPAIGPDGTIYASICEYYWGLYNSVNTKWRNGGVYALDANGLHKWKFTPDQIRPTSPTPDSIGYVITSPTVSNDGTKLYVADSNFIYYGVDAAGGQKAWRSGAVFTSLLTVDPSPAVVGVAGEIYVVYGNVIFLFTQNGIEGYPLDIGVTSKTPAITPDGSRIYVGINHATFGRGVICLKQADGQLEIFGPPWTTDPNVPTTATFQTAGIVNCPPCLGPNGIIYCGDSLNNVYAINPDKTQRWTINMGAGRSITSGIVLGNNNELIFGDNQRTVYCVRDDIDHATILWTYTLPNTIPPIDPNPPAIPDYTNPTVVGDPWTGYPNTDEVSVSPAVSKDGTVFVGCGDGYMYMLDSRVNIQVKDRLRWRFALGPIGIDGYRTPPILSNPVISKTDGSTYIQFLSGYLYKLHGSAPLSESSNWPMFMKTPAHGGR
jgi:hypothetical protein